jgi:Lon protease-like protein
MSTDAIELPLFPLNVVLFPGTVMPLHIFEMRYRQMIVDCVQEHKPFGIVLAKPESKHLQEVPYSTGTIAEISNLEELEDGRYTLMAIGTTRFRILSQNREKAYLSGVVEPFEDTKEEEKEEKETEGTKAQAHRLFRSYLKILLEAADEEEMHTNLPNTAEELSYFIAYFIDIPDERKQEFLEMTSTKKRLQDEVEILRKEVPFMKQMLLMQPSEDAAKLN